MKTAVAIDYYGSRSALANALGISVQAITQWGDEVPPRRALELERLTNGALSLDPAYPKRTPAALVTTAAMVG